MSVSSRPPVVLSIAGSDSGGGAGIQADLKAFAAAGVHGTTAITAVTAQNTVGVAAIHPVPPEVIVAQVRAVASDIGVDAVKVGMLGDVATIEAVAGAIGELGDLPVVVDPVMVSESGAVLLSRDARTALVERILPLASVATPNLSEARVLAEGGSADPADLVALAMAVRRLGPEAVVLTGGHTEDGVDRLVDGHGRAIEIGGPRHADGAAHGSGCTHSSSLAAHLARGHGVVEAARLARSAAAAAVRQGLRGIGSGAGPVDVLGIRE